MDRGAWWATIHRVAESDMTEAHTCREGVMRLKGALVDKTLSINMWHELSPL